MGAVVKIWLESLISMLTIKDSRIAHCIALNAHQTGMKWVYPGEVCMQGNSKPS